MKSKLYCSNLFPICLIGDSQSGKSQFLNQYCNNDFLEEYIQTIGVEFNIKQINNENESSYDKQQIWDLAGDEKFKAIVQTYFRGSKAALFFFDLSDPDSFEKLKKNWIPPYIENIIATKSDLVQNPYLTKPYYDCMKYLGGYNKHFLIQKTNSIMAKHLKCIKQYKQLKDTYRKEILQDILRECYLDYDIKQFAKYDKNIFITSSKNNTNIKEAGLYLNQLCLDKFQDKERQKQINNIKLKEQAQQNQKKCQIF